MGLSTGEVEPEVSTETVHRGGPEEGGLTHTHTHTQRFQEATVTLGDMHINIYIACLPFQFFKMPDLIW